MNTNILDTIDLQKLGEHLQQARKSAGMTQADAAQVIDAARTTLVAIEKGKRRLKAKELIKLARAYGKAVSDFVKPEPILQSFSVQFRAATQRSEQEEAAIDPIIRSFEKLSHQYLELEQLMDAPLPRNYPQEYDVTNMPIERAAESIAITERQRLGLGDAPISMLRDVLEQTVGLRIFYLKMPQKFSEIYSFNDRLGGCMAINIGHYEERRRWSMAHGYLHFLAHRNKSVIDFDSQYRRMPESERLAEAFPKYFLMPTSSLLSRFNDIYRTHQKFTPTNLFTLAYYYGVSIEALGYRLEEMKLIPLGTVERLRERGLKVKKVQQELGLEEIQQRSDIVPIHYKHLAIEAFDKGLITEGQFSNYLCVSRIEARHIATLLQEYSSELEVDSLKLDLSEV